MMPEDIRDVFGEGLPSEVMRMGADNRGDTYRLAYTTALGDAVFVLDVFQKKSKRGIATPRRILGRIRARLKSAAEYSRGDRSK